MAGAEKRGPRSGRGEAHCGDPGVAAAFSVNGGRIPARHTRGRPLTERANRFEAVPMKTRRGRPVRTLAGGVQ